MADGFFKLLDGVFGLLELCNCCLKAGERLRGGPIAETDPVSTPLVPIPGQLSECSEEARRAFAAKVLSLSTFVFLCMASVTGFPYIAEDIHDALFPHRRTLGIAGAVLLLLLLVLPSGAKLERTSPVFVLVLFGIPIAIGLCFQAYVLEARTSDTQLVVVAGSGILTNVVISFLAAAVPSASFNGPLPLLVMAGLIVGSGLVSQFVAELGSYWLFTGFYSGFVITELQSILRGSYVYAIDQLVAATVRALFFVESPLSSPEPQPSFHFFNNLACNTANKKTPLFHLVRMSEQLERAEQPLISSQAESDRRQLVSEASEAALREFSSKVMGLETLVFVFLFVVTCVPLLVITEDQYELLGSTRHVIGVIGFSVLILVLVGRFFGKPDRSNTPLYLAILCISTIAAACVLQTFVLQVVPITEERINEALASAILLGGATILTNVVLSCFAYSQFLSTAPYIVVVALLAVCEMLAGFATNMQPHITAFSCVAILLCALIYQLQTILRGTRHYTVHQYVAATVEVLFWRDGH